MTVCAKFAFCSQVFLCVANVVASCFPLIQMAMASTTAQQRVRTLRAIQDADGGHREDAETAVDVVSTDTMPGTVYELKRLFVLQGNMHC